MLKNLRQNRTRTFIICSALFLLAGIIYWRTSATIRSEPVTEAPQPLSSPPQRARSTPPPEIPALSHKSTQLLEHIRSETATYESALKSGEIEFTVTISSATQIPIPPGTEPNYEEQEHWQITYQFDGDYQFYDVKTRKKMELDRRTSSDNWADTHHQYLRAGQMMHVWEKTGTEWKQHPPKKIYLTPFKDAFNPRGWGWSPSGFALQRFLDRLNVVDVKTVNRRGTHCLYLRLYNPGTERLDSNTTYEVWLNPEKGYHATEVIGYERGIAESFRLDPDGTRIFNTRPFLGITHTTYHIERYEPEIWLPQKVVKVDTDRRELTELFPNRSIEDFPLLMNEARIPEATRTQHMQPYFISVMKVELAIFNTPITRKQP